MSESRRVRDAAVPHAEAVEAGSAERFRTIDPSIFGRTVDTLSPVHPVGAGRTNVTIIAPTIVQTDTTLPFAAFQLVAGQRAGAVAMHVEPAAYGLTASEQYDLAFAVRTEEGPCTFSWQAGFDANQLTGSATVDGQGWVSMSLGTFSPGATGVANITQTGGGRWQWHRLVISRPIVLTPL
ncbi:hypothetical protein [Microbacterium sp.]|uniref:hypothetical protein n=1 Tax=Microbacterium sp. TaxID=51671 RepID=UPI0039E6F51D